MEIKSILWFRHGLRLHDNPSLLAAIEYGRKNVKFYPIFIFDGESAGEFILLLTTKSHHITKNLHPRINKEKQIKLMQRDLKNSYT